MKTRVAEQQRRFKPKMIDEKMANEFLRSPDLGLRF
jgi:hypothetical protein